MIARVFRYVKRYPWMATGTMACAVVGTLMVIVFPAVTQKIVDDVIRGNQPGLLMPLIAIGLASFVLQDLLNGLRIILNNSFEQKVIFDLRSDLYAHIQKLPVQWFDERATGDVMTRLVEDVTSVERVLIDGIEQGTVSILQIVIVAGLMYAYSPGLMLVALTPLPFLVVGALAYTLTAKSRYSLQRRAASAMNSLLHDNISGIRQIKTYAAEEREHARFNGASETLRQTTLIVMKVWALYQPSMNFLTSCGLLLVAGFGASWVLEGNLDFGVLVAFLVLSRFLYEPVGRLHQLNQIVQSGRAAGERVFEILDDRPEEDAGKIALTQPLSGDVRYSDVSFSYSGSQPTLKGITFHAKPGEMIALVGPTGAGKSTIINLLIRFYEYEGGQILMDGNPLPSLRREDLRRNIALVTQESFLFNGTVAENLRMGLPTATDSQLWTVLEAANAADFVKRMPKALDTQVGERGVRLSVGEKQRVAIARALLKNPPILVLDEATASVDTATEKLIQEALDHLLANRTSFVIAHRLSTVRHADQILVIDRGEIIERGKHEDLLLAGGLYAKLIHLLEDPEPAPST
ncbi:MAG: ABC transporter ATP-binding protein [Terrimicrobiaceae bacterium]